MRAAADHVSPLVLRAIVAVPRRLLGATWMLAMFVDGIGLALSWRPATRP